MIFDWQLIFFVIAIVIVGAMVYIAVAMTRKSSVALDKEAYQTDFLKIENTLSRENELSFNAVVVDADKLLDRALLELKTPGKNMGDRLRAGKDKFSQLNAVWYAHKLRNQIAHEHRFQLDYKQARHALTTYRQALKDLGAI